MPKYINQPVRTGRLYYRMESHKTADFVGDTRCSRCQRCAYISKNWSASMKVFTTIIRIENRETRDHGMVTVRDY